MSSTPILSPKSHINGKKYSGKKRKASEIFKNSDFSINSPEVLIHNLTPGKLFVMGQGDAGQLGIGPEITEIIKPKVIQILEDDISKNVIQISCGGLHTVVVTSDGKVYTWGCNDESALGRCTDVEDSEYYPGLVEFPDDCFIIKVTAGDSHSAALTNKGVVYGWGVFRDDNGIIGMTESKTIAKKPEIIYSNPLDICVDICSGNDHMLFLTKSKMVLSCGSAAEGQLGRVSDRFKLYRGSSSRLEYLLKPSEVNLRSLKNISRGRSKSNIGSVNGIFCGKCSSFLTTDNGHIFGWGLNNYFQVCEAKVDRIFFPQPLVTLMNQIPSFEPGLFKISGGLHHTLVLHVQSGILYSFGSNLFGRLGHGKSTNDETYLSFPTPLDIDGGKVKFNSVCCGESTSFAISDDGKLYSWGFGSNRQLGSEVDDDIWIPLKVTSKSLDDNKKILYVSSGAQHTVIIQSL